MSAEAYEEEIDKLLDVEDFDGAAQLKTTYEMQMKEDAWESEAEGVDTEEEVEEEEEDEEESCAGEEDADESTTRILKLLYKGKVEEKSLNMCCPRHTFYKGTRCTNTAQEEQSALPAGVMNSKEDSSDCEDSVDPISKQASKAKVLNCSTDQSEQMKRKRTIPRAMKLSQSTERTDLERRVKCCRTDV